MLILNPKLVRIKSTAAVAKVGATKNKSDAS
jgi:hypothetical protein